jgi:hypothetical protein
MMCNDQAIPNQWYAIKTPLNSKICFGSYYFCNYFFLLNMRKVRTGQEDVFIDKTYHLVNVISVSDPIPD